MCDTIYEKLPKTTFVEGRIIIKPVFQKEGVKFAKDNNAIFSLRLNYTNKHFGNPFSSDERLVKRDNLIKTPSTKDAVKNYIDWVLNSKDDRAKWIREMLKSEKLKNKPIVYYKELNEPSHANALYYLINEYGNDRPTKDDPGR